tara:strand:- start:9112 stop:9297 length:186 start_codon:yes stop_codon:yes gene_type:complete
VTKVNIKGTVWDILKVEAGTVTFVGGGSTPVNAETQKEIELQLAPKETAPKKKKAKRKKKA